MNSNNTLTCLICYKCNTGSLGEASVSLLSMVESTGNRVRASLGTQACSRATFLAWCSFPFSGVLFPIPGFLPHRALQRPPCLEGTKVSHAGPGRGHLVLLFILFILSFWGAKVFLRVRRWFPDALGLWKLCAHCPWNRERLTGSVGITVNLSEIGFRDPYPDPRIRISRDGA